MNSIPVDGVSKDGNRQALSGFVLLEYTHTDPEGRKRYQVAAVALDWASAVQWLSYNPDAERIGVRQTDQVKLAI